MPRSFKRLQQQSGLALPELLIGVFVLGVLTVSITGLAVLGTRTASVNEQRVVAQALANEDAERIRAMAYVDVGYTDPATCDATASSCEPNGRLERVEEVQRNGQTYRINRTITLIDDPFNECISSVCTPAPPTVEQLTESNADYKQIYIKIDLPAAVANNQSTQQAVQVSFFSVNQPIPCTNNSGCPALGDGDWTCNPASLICDPPPTPSPSPSIPPTGSPGPSDSPNPSASPTSTPPPDCTDVQCTDPTDVVNAETCACEPCSLTGTCPSPSPSPCTTNAQCPSTQICMAGTCEPNCTLTGCTSPYQCNTTTQICEPVDCQNYTGFINGGCPADVVDPVCFPALGRLTTHYYGPYPWPVGLQCTNDPGYCVPSVSYIPCNNDPDDPNPWCDTDGDGFTNCGPSLSGPDIVPPDNSCPAGERITCCYSVDQNNCSSAGGSCIIGNRTGTCVSDSDTDFSSVTNPTGCEYFRCEPNPQCSDGFNNDGDSFIDYPNDRGCTSAQDNTEDPNAECSDGIDNDGDGAIDATGSIADVGCGGNPYALHENDNCGMTVKAKTEWEGDHAIIQYGVNSGWRFPHTGVGWAYGEGDSYDHAMENDWCGDTVVPIGWRYNWDTALVTAFTPSPISYENVRTPSENTNSMGFYLYTVEHWCGPDNNPWNGVYDQGEGPDQGSPTTTVEVTNTSLYRDLIVKHTTQSDLPWTQFLPPNPPPASTTVTIAQGATSRFNVETSNALGTVNALGQVYNTNGQEITDRDHLLISCGQPVTE